MRGRVKGEKIRDCVPGKMRMVTMATAAKSHMTQRSECEIKKKGGREEVREGERAGRAGRRQRRGGVKIEWETVK